MSRSAICYAQLLHDEHGSGRYFDQPVGRASSQPIAKRRMTRAADHKQIETVLLDELDNARHRMTGDDMRLELDPLSLGLCASSSDDFFKNPRGGGFCDGTSPHVVTRQESSAPTAGRRGLHPLAIIGIICVDSSTVNQRSIQVVSQSES